MPSYRYTARDERGQAISGECAAASPEALADQLRRAGQFITHFRVMASEGPSDGWMLRLNRIPVDELVLFNVQLAKLIHVGIPLVSALDTLLQQSMHPQLQQTVRSVAKAIESGASFSEALKPHSGVFSALFISMVHAGEISGKLDQILQRLAVFGKRQAEVRQQLVTALTYPCVLALMGVAVITFLVVGIIPKFMKIFVEAGVALPLPTRILYQVSRVLQHYGLLLLAGFIFFIAGLSFWLKRPAGRRAADALILKVPVIGELVRRAALAEMAQTLETLLASGVPVLESLAIAEKTCGNTLIADACRLAGQQVKQGGAISAAFRESKQCPPMLVQMVAIGESSGTVDQMLGEIAGHYDELVQHSIKRLMTLVEPAFLVVMGGMIAIIMASVLMPLFRMVSVIHK